MVPGQSWTFTASRDFHIRLLYLRGDKAVYPLFVYTHPSQRRQGAHGLDAQRRV